MKYFFQGLTVGLAYLAPIGLQNIFVINSALTNNRFKAFLTTFIVIFFDITLALACFFGVGTIMKNYKWMQTIILFLGSLIIIYIGIRLIYSKARYIENSKNPETIFKTISSAFIFTWFNPQAIIDGSMMLGAFQVTILPENYIYFISGILSASFTWFLGLTFIIMIFKNKFNSKILRIINIICGIVIIFYGIKLFLNFISLILYNNN